MARAARCKEGKRSVKVDHMVFVKHKQQKRAFDGTCCPLPIVSLRDWVSTGLNLVYEYLLLVSARLSPHRMADMQRPAGRWASVTKIMEIEEGEPCLWHQFRITTITFRDRPLQHAQNPSI